MTLSHPLLPDGYHVERDADALALLRADGSVVARFSARGVEWEEVERAVAGDAVIAPNSTSSPRGPRGGKGG